MDTSERIARNVKAIAALRNMHLGDVQTAASMSRQSWQKRVNREVKFRYDEIERLADALNVPIETITADPARLVEKIAC